MGGPLNTSRISRWFLEGIGRETLQWVQTRTNEFEPFLSWFLTYLICIIIIIFFSNNRNNVRIQNFCLNTMFMFLLADGAISLPLFLSLIQSFSYFLICFSISFINFSGLHLHKKGSNGSQNVNERRKKERKKSSGNTPTTPSEVKRQIYGRTTTVVVYWSTNGTESAHVCASFVLIPCTHLIKKIFEQGPSFHLYSQRRRRRWRLCSSFFQFAHVRDNSYLTVLFCSFYTTIHYKIDFTINLII